MSSAVMPQSAPFDLQLPSAAWLRNAGAAGVALALHAIVLGLLLAQWSVHAPPAPQVRTLTTQLIALAPPVPPAPPQPEVSAPPPVPVEPLPPVVAPTPDPRIEQRQLEQAALARKRVEQREIEQQRQRDHEQAQRRQAEEQARQRAQAQQLAQQQAQQRQQAEAAAERARQAELAAASRPYQPIVKEAPDYPDRALDKGIEGDCTVRYRVSPQGRVEDPQVVGDCHPLFVRPSLAAARTFRYQPRLVDGQAVAVPDVKNTFHYRIE